VFVENRTAAQYPRADVDLTYRTDSNLLRSGNIQVGRNIYGSALGGISDAIQLRPDIDIDKRFLFTVDSISGTYIRSSMEMPVAEVDKAVTLAFPHDNSTSGYIFNQGADTNGTEWNDALVIFQNGGNVKIGTITSGNGTKIWEFNQIGTLRLPNSAVIKDSATNSISFGSRAGDTGQGNLTVAIGSQAGEINQGLQSTAVGSGAGNYNQGIGAVAIGTNAGGFNQGLRAVAIGGLAGAQNQGEYAVALGNFAGGTNQPNNSIVINASGTPLSGSASGLFIDPIREVAGTKIVYYNTTTKELTYADSTIELTPFIRSKAITSGSSFSAYGITLAMSGSNPYIITAAVSGAVGGQTVISSPNYTGGISTTPQSIFTITAVGQSCTAILSDVNSFAIYRVTVQNMIVNDPSYELTMVAIEQLRSTAYSSGEAV
jgi:hypothetical protein